MIIKYWARKFYLQALSINLEHLGLKQNIALALATVLLFPTISALIQSPFLEKASAAQSEVNGTMQERVTEHPTGDIVYNSRGDGTFSFKILDDGSVQGKGEIQRTYTLSGAGCNIEKSDSGTVNISGKADLSSKKIRLNFTGDASIVASYQCGDVTVGVYSPTYRFSDLKVDLVLEAGAMFEDPHNQPCEPSDICIIRIAIGQISGAVPGSCDFSISASDSSLTVAPGGSVETRVAVNLEKGTAQPVTLKVGTKQSELLKTVKVSLTPVTGNPPFSSDLTIITSPDTPKGTFTIAIVGEGCGITRYTTLTLVVKERFVEEEPDFDLSVFAPSPTQITEGESAHWTVKIIWKSSKPMQVTVSLDTPLKPWHHYSWIGCIGGSVRDGPCTAPAKKEVTLGLTINANRDLTTAHVYQTTEYPQLQITAVAKKVMKNATVSLTVLPCSADWITLLPAGRVGESSINLGPLSKVRDGSFVPTGQAKYNFKADDPSIVSWIKFQIILPMPTPSHKVKWEWIDPSGKLVRTNLGEIPATPKRCVFWPSYNVADELPNKEFANKPGKWTVKVYFDGASKLTLNFQVSSAPTSDVSVQMKETKRSIIVSMKNLGDTPIQALKLKVIDAKFKFIKSFSVKAKNWETKKVDESTVLITLKTPLNKNEIFKIVLMADKRSPTIEWSAFDVNNKVLASGEQTPVSSGNYFTPGKKD